MDELEIPEIIVGIVDKSMKEYKLALVETLTNKVADAGESLSKLDVESIINTVIKQLQLKERNSAIINTFLILLSNLTVHVTYCEILMEKLESDPELYVNFREIIENFLSNNPQLENDVSDESEWIITDPWQFTASILCNLCQIQSGRRLVLQQSYNYMPRIVEQVRVDHLIMFQYV